MEPTVLIIDNFDSFTYNLVQLVREKGCCKPDIIKNDELDIEQVERYDGIIFSPGSGIPQEVPLMSQIVLQYQESKSILGICLGHQAIAETYHAKLFNMKKVVHGIRQKVQVIDKEDYLFHNIPKQFTAGLYHSWAVDKEDFPETLKITAISTNNTIMALSHRVFDVKGIQFHPESYMTEYGAQMIKNWLEYLRKG